MNAIDIDQKETLKKYLVKEGEMFGGWQRVYKFPNDYGASIISNEFSYGGTAGLAELAVLKWDGKNSSLCYTTPITDGVIGNLKNGEVLPLLEAIKSLN
jgi:hypothetical protein